MIIMAFWRARLQLAWLYRQRNSLVRQTKNLKSNWTHTSSSDVLSWNRAWSVWRNSVAKLQQTEAKIRQYENYLNKGATTASLNLAKAVGVFEGGQGRDGLFHPYQDIVGVWTIGYGHTAADGAPIPNQNSRPLSIEEATTLLLHDLSTFYAPAVRKALKGYNWKVNQKMFDALVDFAYNLGPGLFSVNHTIGSAMSHRNGNVVANTILLYNKAGGQTLAGLVRRRQWEKQLFLGGHYSVN